MLKDSVFMVFNELEHGELTFYAKDLLLCVLAHERSIEHGLESFLPSLPSLTLNYRRLS
jgi:hypothetical protein